MATLIAGLRGSGTADWGTSERPKNFRESILWLNPNGMTPLTALMSKAKKQTTDDPEYNWYEEEMDIVRLTMNGAAAVADDDWVVVSGANNLKTGDLLLVETTMADAYANEIVQVNVVTSDTVFSVIRPACGTTEATVPDATVLTLIGSQYAEGVGAPDAVSRNPTKFVNYTQIFKDAYELTGTAEQTRFRTGDPIKNDKKRKMFDHATRMELGFLFGRGSVAETGGTNGKPLRTTNGILGMLADAKAGDSSGGHDHCVKHWTAAPTAATFLTAAYKMFDFTRGGQGSTNERIVFAGNLFLNKLNTIAVGGTNERIKYDGIVKVYGMNLQRWVLPQGELYIRTHPLLNRHAVFSESAFFLDFSGIVYRPMKGRDTRFQDNIQANDADSRKGQWITEAGLEMQHTTTMAYWGAFDQ